MPEIKPKNEQEQPFASEAGADFYLEQEAKIPTPRNREWATEGEREHLADQVNQIVKLNPEAPAAEIHTEAGVPLPKEIPPHLRLVHLEKLIATGRTSDGKDATKQGGAFELNQQLEGLLNETEK